MQPETTEYEELRNAGLTDEVILMLRSLGASHAAILTWAKNWRQS